MFPFCNVASTAPLWMLLELRFFRVWNITYDLFGTKPVADRTLVTVVTCPYALTAYNFIYCWDTVIWRGLVFVWILIFERCHLLHLSPCDWNWVVVAPVPTTVLPQLFPFSAHLLHIWAQTFFLSVCPKSQPPVTRGTNAVCSRPTAGKKDATDVVLLATPVIYHQWLLGSFLWGEKVG